MSLYETFKLSLKNILSSKMRTFLTMLGIIIGCAAVIVIMGVGTGMENYMRDQFASLGSNLLTVIITGRGTNRSVSEDDMYELVEENSEYLDMISPYVTMTGVKLGNDVYFATSVTGINEYYFEMRDLNVAEGRGLEYMDMVNRNQVCIVGEYINRYFFDGAAIGQTLKVNGNTLTIVGIMEQQDDDEDLEEGCTDDCVYLPYTTAARWSYTGTISTYYITVVDEDTASTAADIVETMLFSVFQDDDYYTVVSMTELLDTLTSMINVVVTVLAIIAGISLLVGGIGIMNIMLVSVTERTREIGIRKALGAKERTILSQFVIEAAMTSALGGIIGILFGEVISSVGSVVVQGMLDADLTISPTAGAIGLSFGISAGIGVLFGYLPARRAAALNPIDALRYD
ncbi:MAG: ABC transporter permease [Oscillospiraceae bacterium]|nr:ABC transporter permease [Oscillospiraceae bacterium]MCD8388813.1 ABC transporter permease [Oscillospiraceae bacterium]